MTFPTHAPGSTFAPRGARAATASAPIGSSFGPARARARGNRQGIDTARWTFFLLLHVPLVALVKLNPWIATAHALGTFALAFGSLRFRTPERVVLMMGYIIASESLWRVGDAKVFYESGKYMIGALSLLALVRYRLLPFSEKGSILYFALLLPSILVMPAFDRKYVSFNLSGPFALAACSMFLSTLMIPAQKLKKLLLAILAPILGLAVVATFATVTTENVNFYTSKVAAGGLGNNQASSIFGLGLLAAVFYLVIDRTPQHLRWFVAVIGLWCGAQGMLTFSRGGVMTAVGALAAAAAFLIGDRRTRKALLLRAGLLTLLAVYVVVPQLNAFTGGDLARRFTDSSLTGRDKIIEADLRTFKENPVMGVGPGMSRDYRIAKFGRGGIAHTEYSRLLAEHGSFGLAALLLLGWMAVMRLRRRSSAVSVALSAAFTVWASLFMFHAAMRMAAVSFIFALGTAHFMTESANAFPRRRVRATVP